MHLSLFQLLSLGFITQLLQSEAGFFQLLRDEASIIQLLACQAHIFQVPAGVASVLLLRVLLYHMDLNYIVQRMIYHTRTIPWNVTVHNYTILHALKPLSAA